MFDPIDQDDPFSRVGVDICPGVPHGAAGLWLPRVRLDEAGLADEA